MQVRPEPNGDGRHCWLNETERAALTDRARDSRQEVAYRLGLTGLRSEEIVDVTPRDVTTVERDGRTVGFVTIRRGKKDKRRRVPTDPETIRVVERLARDTGTNRDESVVDRTTGTLRKWIGGLREEIAEELRADDRERDASHWGNVSFHDLRRSWANSHFYRLAVAGNPIAEKITLAHGGWKDTPKGREILRTHYLGPVPEWVSLRAADTIGHSEETTETTL